MWEFLRGHQEVVVGNGLAVQSHRQDGWVGLLDQHAFPPISTLLSSSTCWSSRQMEEVV